MKNILKKGIIAVILSVSVYGIAYAAILQGLTHYWKLDESSGTASDYFGNLRLTNINTAPYVSAKINNGINGNGTNQYLASSTAGALSVTELTGPFTVNIWQKRLASPAAASYIFRITSQNNGTNYCWITLYYAAGWAIDKCGGGGTIVFADDTTNFYMATIVYNGAGSFAIYKNGVLSDTKALTMTPTASTTAVGNTGILNDGLTGLNAINATVDEMGVWNRALSATEVLALYNGGNGISYPFVMATQGFFRFFGI